MAWFLFDYHDRDSEWLSDLASIRCPPSGATVVSRSSFFHSFAAALTLTHMEDSYTYGGCPPRSQFVPLFSALAISVVASASWLLRRFTCDLVPPRLSFRILLLSSYPAVSRLTHQSGSRVGFGNRLAYCCNTRSLGQMRIHLPSATTTDFAASSRRWAKTDKLEASDSPLRKFQMAIRPFRSCRRRPPPHGRMPFELEQTSPDSPRPRKWGHIRQRPAGSAYEKSEHGLGSCGDQKEEASRQASLPSAPAPAGGVLLVSRISLLLRLSPCLALWGHSSSLPVVFLLLGLRICLALALAAASTRRENTMRVEQPFRPGRPTCCHGSGWCRVARLCLTGCAAPAGPCGLCHDLARAYGMSFSVSSRRPPSSAAPPNGASPLGHAASQRSAKASGRILRLPKACHLPQHSPLACSRASFARKVNGLPHVSAAETEK